LEKITLKKILFSLALAIYLCLITYQAKAQIVSESEKIPEDLTRSYLKNSFSTK